MAAVCRSFTQSCRKDLISFVLDQICTTSGVMNCVSDLECHYRHSKHYRPYSCYFCPLFHSLRSRSAPVATFLCLRWHMPIPYLILLAQTFRPAMSSIIAPLPNSILSEPCKHISPSSLPPLPMPLTLCKPQVTTTTGYAFASFPSLADLTMILITMRCDSDIQGLQGKRRIWPQEQDSSVNRNKI